MTYSLVARDPETGYVGVASQSHYFDLEREPARAALAWVLERRPSMRSFLRGPAESGIVPAGYESVLPDE
jgi:hypothetical protein